MRARRGAREMKICMALRTRKLTRTWGTPHFASAKDLAGLRRRGRKSVLGFSRDGERAAQTRRSAVSRAVSGAVWWCRWTDG